MWRKKVLKLFLGIILLNSTIGHAAEDDFNTDPPIYPDDSSNIDAPIDSNDDSNINLPIHSGDNSHIDPPVYPDDRPIAAMPLAGADAGTNLETLTPSISLDRPKKIHQDDRILDLEDQVRELSQQNKDLRQQFEELRSDMPKSLPPSPSTPESDGLTTHRNHPLINETGQTSAAILYDQAQTHLFQENYPDAQQILIQLIKQYPQDSLVINAYYWLGESYSIQKNHKQAAAAFAQVYKRYRTLKKEPATVTTQFDLVDPFVKVPEALIKLARSLKAMGQTTEACIPLNQVQLEFPQLPANIEKSLELAKKDLPQCRKNDKNTP